MGYRNSRDVGAPLAGRKNLSNGSLDNYKKVPSQVPLRKDFFLSPFAFPELAEPNSTGWIHDVILGHWRSS